MIDIIDQALAQQIVNAIGEVVEKDINFINREGMIIASTDAKRITTFHQAGHEAVIKKETVVVTDYKKYEGAKTGANYPITIDGQVIGVIGITGDPEEIMKLGFIASKITEIFIREEQITTRYESRKKLIQYMMNRCIYEKDIEPKEVEEMLQNLHVKASSKYHCVVIEIRKSNVDFINMENQILTLLERYNVDFYNYHYPNRFIIFIPVGRLKEIIKLLQRLGEEYENTLYSGVGEGWPILQIKQSYETALIALKYARQSKQAVVESRNLDIEWILEKLPNETKQKYIYKVIGKLTSEEIELLKNYYACNMSLKDTAENLYIHKNTVQYRLDKIYEKIGLNPRVFKQSARIYLAIHMTDIN